MILDVSDEWRSVKCYDAIGEFACLALVVRFRGGEVVAAGMASAQLWLSSPGTTAEVPHTMPCR